MSNKNNSKLLSILLSVSSFLLLLSFSFIIYLSFFDNSNKEDIQPCIESNDISKDSEHMQQGIHVIYLDDGLKFVDHNTQQTVEIKTGFPYTQYFGMVEAISDTDEQSYVRVTIKNPLQGGASGSIAYHKNLETLFEILSKSGDNFIYENNDIPSSFEELEPVEDKKDFYYIKKPTFESSHGFVISTTPVDITDTYKAVTIIRFDNFGSSKEIDKYDPNNQSQVTDTDCLVSLSDISEDSSGYIQYSVSQALSPNYPSDACENLSDKENFSIAVY